MKNRKKLKNSNLMKKVSRDKKNKLLSSQLNKQRQNKRKILILKLNKKKCNKNSRSKKIKIKFQKKLQKRFLN